MSEQPSAVPVLPFDRLDNYQTIGHLQSVLVRNASHKQLQSLSFMYGAVGLSYDENWSRELDTLTYQDPA
jgi:hypothetical protein